MRILIMVSLFAVTLRAENLNGDWFSSCYSDASWGYTKQISVVENDWRVQQTRYRDNGCTEAEFVITYRGVAEQLPSASGGTNLLNFKHSAVSMRQISAFAVESANLLFTCGNANWELNKEQDIAGRGCLGIGRMPSVGEVLYTLLGEGSENDLYLGLLTQALNGRSPETRPTELDRGLRFIRQSRKQIAFTF